MTAKFCLLETVMPKNVMLEKVLLQQKINSHTCNSDLELRIPAK